MKDDLFIGVYPGGLSFADKSREEGGDYMRVAFLPYDTLELKWIKKCDLSMRSKITRVASDMRVMRGRPFPIDSCGHTVTLGKVRTPI